MAGSPQHEPNGSGGESACGRLDSWKEIATYLGRSERTVRRWEHTTGLPVHRLPQKRASVYAFRSELDAWWQGHGSGLETNGPAPTIQPKAFRLPIGQAALAICLGCLGVVCGLALWRASRPARQPTFKQLTFHAGKSIFPAVSRDGKLLAFVSDRDDITGLNLWVQPLAGSQSIRVTHHGGTTRHLDFSPDGSTLAFRSEIDGGGIYLTPVAGGEIRKLADRGYHPRYSPDGKWLTTSKLMLLPTGSGEPRRVCPEFELIGGPALWSKDGKRLLFLGAPAKAHRAAAEIDWWVASLDGSPPVRTGASRALERQGLGPVLDVFPMDWDDEWAVFYIRSGEATNVWRIGLSLRTAKVTGPAQQITFGPSDSTPRFVSGGRVVFVNDSEITHIWSLPLDSNHARPLGEPRQLTRDASLVPQPRGVYPRLSTDGRKVVFVSHRSGVADVWQQNLQTGDESAMQVSPLPDEATLISADGSQVAFSAREGADPVVYVTDTSGRPPRKICKRCGVLMDWSADGRRMLFGTGNPQGISLLMVEDGHISELAKDEQRHLRNAVFSPDGGWLAWEIDENVVVARFLNEKQLDAKDAIVVARTIDSYGYPQWSPDGSLIYFLSKENGYRCIWAQRLDPATKAPRGQPIGVWHLHEPLRKIWTIAPFSISRDRLVVPLTEGTSNIWMANWK